MVGCDLRSPLYYFGRLPDLAWGDLHVDQVVVYGDRARPGIEVRSVEGESVDGALRSEIEEPIVDYDVTVHEGDAGLAYLLCDLVESRERVFGGERRARHAVGVGVVDVGVGDGPVGHCSSAHGEVALRNQHQVAAERIVLDFSLRVERRLEAVIETEVVEGRRDAEELGRGAGDVQAVRRAQRVH